MTQPDFLGAGEIADRYALARRERNYPTPLPSLPWYYDQTKTSTFAIILIAALVAWGLA